MVIAIESEDKFIIEIKQFFFHLKRFYIPSNKRCTRGNQKYRERRLDGYIVIFKILCISSSSHLYAYMNVLESQFQNNLI